MSKLEMKKFNPEEFVDECFCTKYLLGLKDGPWVQGLIQRHCKGGDLRISTMRYPTGCYFDDKEAEVEFVIFLEDITPEIYPYGEDNKEGLI